MCALRAYRAWDKSKTGVPLAKPCGSRKRPLHEAMRSQQSSVNKLPRLNEKRKGMKQPLGLSKEQAVDSGFSEDPNQLVRFGFE